LALNRIVKKATTRPSDAATLVIVRFDGPVPRILMGRRHQSHVFMPGKYVFPGGRTEPLDGRKAVAFEGHPVTIEKLKLRMGGKPSNARARGMQVAAIRETFEETGLLVGQREAHHAPDLRGLIYFARAITPPGRSRRFDSRFFVCDAALVANLDLPHPVDVAELLALKWFTPTQAMDLDLPSITRDILVGLEPFLAQKTLPRVDCPVSFHHIRGKAWVVDMLQPGET
jgi:8-oxo-dGTP pyrophosphatase MutT (NUDIX family)